MEQLIETYQTIPPARRYALVLAIIGVLIGGHYYFIFGDQEAEIERLQKKYNEKQITRNSKQSIAQNKDTYIAKLAKLQEQLDKARAQLPDSADVPQLLAQLGNRARQTGLAIDEFKPAAERKLDFVAEISFRMKVKGSFHDIAMFIDSVGKLDRIINIANLTMENPEILASKVIVSSRFDVRTYRFVQEKKP